MLLFVVFHLFLLRFLLLHAGCGGVNLEGEWWPVLLLFTASCGLFSFIALLSGVERQDSRMGSLCF